MASLDSFSFEAIGLSLLASYGVPGIIIVGISVALTVKSWIDPVRKIVEIGTGLRDGIIDRSSGLAAEHNITAGIIVTTIVVPLQAALLALWYTIGAYINLVPERGRITQIKLVHEVSGFTPALERFLAPSPAAVTCGLIGLAALAYAYLHSLAGDDPGPAATFMAAPGTAIMWIAFWAAKAVAAVMLFGAVILLLGAFLGTHEQVGWLALAPIGAVAGLAAFGALYKLACEVGVRAAELVVHTWAPDEDEEPFEFSDLVGDWPWDGELALRRRLREERQKGYDY